MMDHMRWAPDPWGEALETGYMRFISDAGIHGLAKVVGVADLHLLAVVAIAPGTGQFRDFINRCKADCQNIYIWAIADAVLPATLARYGFKPTAEEQKGEVVEGMVWSRR